MTYLPIPQTNRALRVRNHDPTDLVEVTFDRCERITQVVPFGDDGRVMVLAPGSGCQIGCYTAGGQLIYRFGRPEVNPGDGHGRLRDPRGLVIHRDFVVVIQPGRYCVFKVSGQWVSSVIEPRLVNPTHLAVERRSDRVVGTIIDENNFHFLNLPLGEDFLESMTFASDSLPEDDQLVFPVSIVSRYDDKLSCGSMEFFRVLDRAAGNIVTIVTIGAINSKNCQLGVLSRELVDPSIIGLVMIKGKIYKFNGTKLE